MCKYTTCCDICSKNDSYRSMFLKIYHHKTFKNPMKTGATSDQMSFQAVSIHCPSSTHMAVFCFLLILVAATPHIGDVSL